MDGMLRLWRCVVLPAMAAALVLCVTPALAGAAEPLSPYVSVSGEHLATSIDAFGSNSPEGGPIRVQKNSGAATVRAAYLFAASTGASGYSPKNGDVTLNGQPVEWEEAHTISSDIGSFNAVADVTSIVKPVVDPAPAGLTSLTVAEGQLTGEYDGEILAVLLEDPSVNELRSVTLLYGAQNPLGDTFHVGLSEPVNKSNPAFQLNLSLGISFGYQPSGQFSTIKVNEKLMTSSAGGQDDCSEKFASVPNFVGGCDDGTLITAGGIGDTTENPPNPEATDESCENEAHETAPRCDDELYSLLPFLNNGDSALSFSTENPSDNDNIFFGALEVRGGAAIVGEGITLAPATGTNKVGESHTVTASVQNSQGEPLSGAAVHFQVVSGPNAGLTGEATTSAGKASFAYSSSTAGTDHIVASFTNAHGIKDESNVVSETWEALPAPAPPAAKPAGGVLAFGSAHLASSSKACVARTGYLASVSGKAIKSVTFSLDGHRLKTLSKANSHGAFTYNVGVSAGKTHRLSIHVVFTSASHTAAKTITKRLARCAAVRRVTKPRFTG
jgi:Bacterial Ig-like domain (group 1)